MSTPARPRQTGSADPSPGSHPAPSPVPASIDDLSADWLTQALRRDFPSARIRTWQAQRIGADFGFASQVHRLVLDADLAPPTLVLKLWQGADAAALREARFFQTFGAAAQPWVVHCHFAQADSQAGCGVLVLEDLSDTEQGDCLDLISTARGNALAESLATLHARWWRQQQDQPQPTDWLPGAPAIARGDDWYAQRRGRFLRRFAGRLQGPALPLLAKVEARVAMASARLQRSWTTLVHRDLHLDNVRFRRPQGLPVILDWAQVSVGSPALDLAALCFELDRLEDFATLARQYRQTLQQQGGPALDADDFQAMLGAGLLLRFASATCGVAQWQTHSARAELIVATGITRAARAVQLWQHVDPELFRP